MKKFLTTTLVALIFLFSLTGCGSTTLNLKAQYWYEDEAITTYKPIKETIVYDVSVVSKTPSNSQEIKNENVWMEIDKGTYTVTLQDGTDGNGNACYVYSTALEIEGKYVSATDFFEFKDKVTSTTKFYNIIKEFKPISSKKSSSCSTLVVANSNGYGYLQFAYDYTIDYQGENAITNYNIDLLDEGGNVIKNYENRQLTFKDCFENAYVDNELLMLVPRAYNYNSAFSLNFNTIDVVTQKNQTMLYNASGSNSSIDIKNFNLFYDLGGEMIGAENLAVAKVKIEIDDTFSGYPIEAYYITDHKTHRHRMAEVYTALNNEMGYLKYTIKKVELK